MFKKLFGNEDYRHRFILTIDGEDDGGEGGGAGDTGGTDQNQQGQGEQQGGAQGQSQQGEQQAGQQQQQFGQRRGGSDWIPKHRFDQVNRGYQAYKRFGSPEQIQQQLDTLQRLQQNPANKYDQKTAQEIREDFLMLFPEMRSLVGTHQNQTIAFVSHGVRQNESFLKELNIEINETNNQLLQDAIGGIIARDPDLNARFYARDSSVFAEGFSRFKKLMNLQQKRVVPGLDATRNKTVSRVPSKPNGNGGTPPKPKQIQPGPLFERETLDQASEEAFARLSEQME